MKGHKTVIPRSLQREYIGIVHGGHPGLDATKHRTSGIIFWPTMTADITAELIACSDCNSTKPHQQKEPLKLYPVPDMPWSTVATDMFEWRGQNYLVLVDSGWYEIDLLRGTTSSAVIGKLKRHFSVHGFPHTLISDNARQYTSQQFKGFAKQWDFIHVTSSPEFPQRKAVCNAKQLMEKSQRWHGCIPQSPKFGNIPRDSTVRFPCTTPVVKTDTISNSVNSSCWNQLPKHAQIVYCHNSLHRG